MHFLLTIISGISQKRVYDISNTALNVISDETDYIHVFVYHYLGNIPLFEIDPSLLSVSTRLFGTAYAKIEAIKIALENTPDWMMWIDADVYGKISVT